MSYKNEIYEAVDDADEWIVLDEIVRQVRKEYSTAPKFKIRQELREMVSEGYIRKKDNELSYQIKE